MHQIRLAGEAEGDIEAILLHSFQSYGAAAAERYEGLIVLALQDLAGDPLRPDSSPREELAPALRSYHLRHCRKRAARLTSQVKQPRHVVMYRIAGNTVEIVRILHDSMDFSRHIAGGSEDET